MVSPGPSVKAKNRRRGKRKIHRPQDIREGVTNAYYIVKEVKQRIQFNFVDVILNVFFFFFFTSYCEMFRVSVILHII